MLHRLHDLGTSVRGRAATLWRHPGLGCVEYTGREKRQPLLLEGVPWLHVVEKGDGLLLKAHWRQRNYLLTSDRSERFKQSKEFKLTGRKRTLRGDLIERRGSSEAWYGGDNPRREATPCFDTQLHCLQVQLARHCLLANEPSASVAPSVVWRRSRDLIEGGCPSR